MHWIDPAYLPETKGTVYRFLLNRHGEADGLLLKHGMEVHFPPYLSEQVVAALAPGAAVTIHGVRPRGTDMVDAVSLESTAGVVIFDRGPPKDHRRHRAAKQTATDPRIRMEVDGVVQRILHGPKGAARGVLLEDGTIVRIPPHRAEALLNGIAPGQRLAVRGKGLTNSLGTVVAARKTGLSLTTLHPVKPKHHEAAASRPGDAPLRIAQRT